MMGTDESFVGASLYTDVQVPRSTGMCESGLARESSSAEFASKLAPTSRRP